MLDLPPTDPGIEVSISSRGISKGIAQTDGPQLVVRPEVVFGPVFVGAYAKNVSSPAADGEAAALIGVRTGAGGFDLTASAAYKLGIDPENGFDDGALELSGALSRRIGPVTPRLSLVWSPDDVGGTGRTTFAEAGATLRLAPHTSASTAIGRREREGGPDYTAFNAGISHTVAGHLTFDLRWYDTSRSDFGEIYEARLVGSLRARF